LYFRISYVINTDMVAIEVGAALGKKPLLGKENIEIDVK
jgi:hypothetical protein